MDHQLPRFPSLPSLPSAGNWLTLHECPDSARSASPSPFSPTSSSYFPSFCCLPQLNSLPSSNHPPPASCRHTPTLRDGDAADCNKEFRHHSLMITNSPNPYRTVSFPHSRASPAYPWDYSSYRSANRTLSWQSMPLQRFHLLDRTKEFYSFICFLKQTQNSHLPVRPGQQRMPRHRTDDGKHLQLTHSNCCVPRFSLWLGTVFPLTRSPGLKRQDRSVHECKTKKQTK